MNCQNCGNVSENNIFCDYCGKDFEEKDPKLAFKKENFNPFSIGDKEALVIFKNWAKSNKKQDIKNVEIKKSYFPVHVLDGNVFNEFVYSVGSIDSKGIFSFSKNTTSTNTFDKKKAYYPASSLIDYSTLDKLKPFDFDNKKIKNDDVEVLVATKAKKAAEINISKNYLNYYRNKLYKSLTPKEVKIHKEDDSFKSYDGYIHYLPFYFGSYTFKDKNYLFYINANNKKITGNKPVNVFGFLKVILVALFLLLAILVTIILF